MALLKQKINKWLLIDFLSLTANAYEEGSIFLRFYRSFHLQHMPLFLYFCYFLCWFLGIR